ncbi:DUF2147 domain-containing protein [Ferrovibrio sp. MS7]|uniref:DUF2147 domain-containing protein n=1 Tax=Ferrovibrio plantarum TaxID=3119164 RepID=UPI003134A761
MRRLLLLAAALLCLASAPAEAADLSSPMGRWRTIDDETGSERSIVDIALVGGELQGRIVKIFLRPDEKPDAVCDKCEGERKDQPIIGMTFLWGLKPDGSSKTEWAGGAILDPKNGKVYNAKAALADNGQTLRVRGFIGTPLLGRSQVWKREAE